MTAINFDQVNQLVEQGYISQQNHPTLPLRIFNYTPQTQFEKHWTPETKACRGLIVGPNDEIVARPFPKFFNVGEVETTPDGQFQVFEKLDGSLGILWQWEGHTGIATRGSFTSPQAQEANRIFEEYYLGQVTLKESWTYLFEIIYPENRIVVDYKDTRNLFLLAIVETQTGKERSLTDMVIHFPKVKEHPKTQDFRTLTNVPVENAEGFVIYWPACQTRLKLKYEEYVRLHKLVTQMSNKAIWEMLRDGQEPLEALKQVPKEFYAWAEKVVHELQAHFKRIEDCCQADYAVKPETTERKQIAEFFKLCDYPSILFQMLDGKDYRPTIWKIVRPKIDHPFKTQGEDI